MNAHEWSRTCVHVAATSQNHDNIPKALNPKPQTLNLNPKPYEPEEAGFP